LTGWKAQKDTGQIKKGLVMNQPPIKAF